MKMECILSSSGLLDLAPLHTQHISGTIEVSSVVKNRPGSWWQTNNTISQEQSHFGEMCEQNPGIHHKEAYGTLLST